LSKNPIRLLIVDDNIDHQLLMKEAVQESIKDVRIMLSNTGKDCLHKIAEENFDMLIIDYSLSEINGLELLKSVTQRGIDIPVVMVTAFGNEDIAVDAMKLGAYDYIVKSEAYSNKLSATILRAINQHDLKREKKKVEKKLIESESRYRALIENIIDIVFLADKELNIVSINPAFQRIFECSMEDAKELNLYKSIYETDRKMVVDYFRSAFSNKKKLVETLEFRIKTKKDNIKHVELNAKINYDNEVDDNEVDDNEVDDNKVDENIQIEGVIRDITERKKIEYKMSQIDKLNALELQSSGIAHEFNNILGIILGYLNILRLKLKGASQQVYDSINVIEKAAKDGATIVDKIQQFSETKPEYEIVIHVDLIDIIHEAVDFTMPRWKNEAQSKGIEYQIITNNLNPSKDNVRCNPSELREVIVNIINNSIDAMPDGGKIEFSSKVDAENITVSISDNGTGIKEEIKGKIFDPFFTTKGVKGSGLGMSVAYSIVTKYGGELNVESHIGEGTTIHLKMSLYSSKITTIETTQETVTEFKANVLVIEDEEVILEMLKIILEDKGHKVFVAKDANDGLKMYQENRYDVVLCDLAMPKLNGWKVARYIKDLDAARNTEKTPFILITGYELDIEKLDYRKEGVDFILKKPLEFDQLNKIINNFIIDKQ